MTSKQISLGSSLGTDRRLPPNGTFGDLQTCFVCNQHFHNSEPEEAALKELERIQNTFYEVFGISTKRRPEPFRDNPFCVGCERKAKEVQRIATELESLQEQLEAVRNEMASSIVSTYIYSSKESPNFEMKHLIFEKWYKRVQDFKVVEPKLSVHVAEVPKPKAPSIPVKVATSGAPLTRPTGSEREVARLIQQNDERLSHDPKSDNLEEASCIICSKVCRNKDILEVHLKTHAEERPFLCRLCGKSFFGKAILKKHLQQKHPDLDHAAVLTEIAATVKIRARSPAVSDKDVTDDSAVPGIPESNVKETSPKVGLKRKKIQCEMCGKAVQHKKALQKHIRKFHSNLSKRKKCTICGKMCQGPCKCTNADEDQSLPTLNEADYSDDNYEELEQNPPTPEPEEKSNRFSLQTDKEDVKIFKKCNPAYRNIQFNVFVRVERLPSSTERPGPSNAVEVDEEEKRAPHILKSVAWKAKGAWFTQEKKSTMPPTVKPLSLQSNWKSFIQKTKPKPIPVGPRIINPYKVADSYNSPVPVPAVPDTSPDVDPPVPSEVSSEEIEKSEPDISNASNVLVAKTEESSVTNNPVQAQGMETETMQPQPVKRPSESISSSVSTPAKRPTDTVYWGDPKNVMQSAKPTNPAGDVATASPFLAKALATAKSAVTGTTLKKPGPLSMKKLSDITQALRLGQKKKPGPKPALPPVSRPSSEQITKLARQLRKSGVGTAKGRFDPVFQLHALGGSAQAGASRLPSTLALSRNMEVLASESANKRGSGSGSPVTVTSDNDSRKSTPTTNVRPRPCPASRKPAAPSMPLLETTLEVETDILTLMQNSSVTIMPSSTVRSPADVSHQIQRSLKRMAGPRSKTKIFRPPGDAMGTGSPMPQSVSPAPSNSPSFRFVDVEAVLSGATEAPTINNNNNIDISISSVTSLADQNNAGISISSVTSLADQNNVSVKTAQEDNDSDVELIESDSDFEEDDMPKIRIRNLQSLADPDEDDVPKIRIRNLQSLAEPEESDGDDEVMEMENTETYIPGRSGTNAIPSEVGSMEPTFDYQYHQSPESVANVNISIDALTRVNDDFRTTAPKESSLADRNGGIFSYSENRIRKFFTTAEASQAQAPTSHRSTDQPRPTVVPTPRIRIRSPPPETYVYTISPGSMPIPDEDEIIEDMPGPVITNVYSTLPAPPLSPPTIIPRSMAPQPIVSATVKTAPQRRRRKSSPSLINEADLDLLLGL